MLRQCLQLIACFPQLAVYGYHVYDYGLKNNNSFFIHDPNPEFSTAENLLYMLRIDGKFSPLEAKVLDIALVLRCSNIALISVGFKL